MNFTHKFELDFIFFENRMFVELDFIFFENRMFVFIMI